MKKTTVRLISKSKLKKIWRSDPMRILKDLELWLAFAYHMVRIKDEHQQIVRFIPNPAQMRLVRMYIKNRQEWKEPFYIVSTKGRQATMTTICDVILVIEICCRTHNVRLIADVRGETETDSAGGNMLAKFTTALEHIYPNRADRYSQFTKGVGFTLKDTGSSVSLASQSRDARGVTLSAIHCSEVAFYHRFEETMAPLLESEHRLPGNLVFFESTSEGGEDEGFHNLCKSAVAGINGFTLFHTPPWEKESYHKQLDDKERIQLEESLNSNTRRYGDEEALMRDHPDVTLEHIAWRRETINRIYNGDLERYRVVYPATWEEAFMGAGNKVFHPKSLNWQQQFIREPIRTGLMEPELSGRRADGTEEAEFVDNPLGSIEIFEEPQQFCEYVWGSDHAEGNPSGDFNVGLIYKRMPFELVAIIRGTDTTKLNKSDFAYQLMYLCRWYYFAKGLPESNNQGSAITSLINEWRYQDIMMNMRDVLPRDYPNARTNKHQGFNMTSQSKRFMVERMIEALTLDYSDDDDGKIKSQWTPIIRHEQVLSELKTFVHKENGKMEARRKGERRSVGSNATGFFDDCVDATGFALLAHQGLPEPETKEELMVRRLGRNHDLTAGMGHIKLREEQYTINQPTDWQDYM